MPATAVAIATSSAATSAALTAEAAAHRAQCIAEMKGYQNDGASIEVAREYARCVDLIYGTGEPLSASAAIMIKIAIVAAFVSVAIGGCLGWKEDGPVGAVMFGFMGLVVAAGGTLGLVAAAAGIYFLFT